MNPSVTATREIQLKTRSTRILYAGLLACTAQLALAQSAPAPAAPEIQAHAASECRALTERANDADLKVANAQAQREEPAKLATLLDRAIEFWRDASQHCEGRAQQRAQRNLTDSERARQALGAQLLSGPECTQSQKSAAELQELAQRALKERRWLDATMLFRKSENLWDDAVEQCSGESQQLAQQKHEQTRRDAHNAEFCAPLFEKASEQTRQLRRIGQSLSVIERQTHSQAAETLWRDAVEQCQGPAQESARGNAQALARERGSAWVRTELPGASAAPAATAATASAPKSGAASAPTRPPAPAPARATGQPPAAQPVTGQPAGDKTEPSAAAQPTELEYNSGDTRFKGIFSGPADKLSGSGQIDWANGDQYRGELREGKRNGQGEFVWANGQRYQGGWVDDLPQGQGQLVFTNGNRYEGEIVQGAPHGKGLMVYASGDRFEGLFAQGKPAGQGRYRWANGQSWNGSWLNEQPHGKGQLRFANGDVFEGQLDQGRPSGQGSLTYASGDRYEGAMLGGVPHGEGEYRWHNGDRYRGQWHSGVKQGQGVLEWSNGDRWEGRFEANQQTSDGQLIRHQP